MTSATVSNVVRDVAGTATWATRADVRAAIDTLGYRPDSVARELRLRPELGVAADRAIEREH